MKARNGLVELYRFFAAVGIALYHFEWVYVGSSQYFVHFYIFVEFFFVLSGFFLVQNCHSMPEQYTAWDYVGRQIKKLYPLYLAAIVFTACITHFLTADSGGGLLAIWQDKWELLLAYIFGWGGTSYNNGGASAYVPALLFASLLLYELARAHRSLFLSVIGPLLIACGYSRIIFTTGNLSVWLQFDGAITQGVIRALAGMSVGILFAEVVRPALAGWKRRTLFVCVILCTFGIPALVLYRNYIGFSDLIFYVFLFALLITSSSRLSLPDLLNSIGCCCGKLSYPIFLFHYGILLILRQFLPEEPYIKSIFVFIISFLMVAAVILFLQQRIHTWLARIKK